MPKNSNAPKKVPATFPVEGAGGVVFNRQGLVLVLGHRNGTWVFPKGHLDPGETDLEAAQREVEEEGGVATTPLSNQTELTRYRNVREEWRVITWYLLGTEATQPILREATFPAGAFVEVEVALSRLSFPEDKRLLRVMHKRYRARST